MGYPRRRFARDFVPTAYGTPNPASRNHPSVPILAVARGACTTHAVGLRAADVFARGGTRWAGAVTGARRKMMGRWLRRVRDAFPLRPFGLLLLGFGAFALHVAFDRLDLVFQVLGYGALGVVGLATLFVALGALWLRRVTGAAQTSLATMETLRTVPSGARFGRLRWMPLVQVRWTVQEGFDAFAGADGREKLQATERGAFAALTRRFVVQDPLGVARLAFERAHETAVEARPHLGKLRRLDTLASFAGGEDLPHPRGSLDGDRVELRRYAPGDPARFIHWKIFSRTRRLMVRMPERSLMQTRRTLAYLVAGEHDEASAALARVAVDGLLSSPRDEWLFAADGSAPTTLREDALRAIVRSKGQSGALGLRPFVEHEEKQGPASLVLIVPPAPGPWLQRCLEVVRARPERCRVLLGVDGFAPEPGSRLRRALMTSEAVRAPERRDVAEVRLAFQALGVPVHIFDRASGRSLGPRELAEPARRAS